jgi:putative ATPase
MKDLGYGKNYKYAHNYKDAVVAQEYLPDKLKGRRFYHPTRRGFEKTIKERLDKWRQLIQQSKANKG